MIKLVTNLRFLLGFSEKQDSQQRTANALNNNTANALNPHIPPNKHLKAN